MMRNQKRNSKLLSWIMAMMLITLALPLQALAAQELAVVYVTNSSLLPTGDGSAPSAPLKDINQAFDKVKDGGEVVIVDGYTSQTMATTPGKKITIKGNTPNAYWSIRYGLTLGGDVTIDSLRLETPSVDRSARYIYLDGHHLELTDCVDTMVNGNYNQRPVIETRSEKSRSRLSLASGNIEEIAITGSMGADLTLTDSVQVTKIVGNSEEQNNTLTISNRQTFMNSLEQFETLRVTGGFVTVPALSVQNVEISGGTLSIQTASQTRIPGQLNAEGGILSIAGDLAVGEVIGHGCEIARGVTSSIISDNPNATAYFSYTYGPDNGWEIKEKVENGKKIWYAAWSDGVTVCYLDGTNGDDNADGMTQNTPVKTWEEAQKKVEGAPTSGKIIVCEEMQLPSEITSPSTALVLAGLTKDTTVYADSNLQLNTSLSIENLTLKMKPEAYISMKEGYYTIDQGVTVIGKPNIYFHSQGNGVNQLDILSGEFGDIVSVEDLQQKVPAKQEGVLCLYGGQAGALYGWESVSFEQADGDILIGGDIDTGYIMIYERIGTVFFDGIVHADQIDFYGTPPLLSMNSGRCIEAEYISLQQDIPLKITIRTVEELAKEGIYIQATNPIDGTIELVNMPGYEWVQESSVYTLKQIPVSLEYTVQGNNEQADVTVAVSGALSEGILFAVAYNESGCVTGITMQPIGRCGRYEMNLIPIEAMAGVKVFLWNNQTALNALCPVGEYQEIEKERANSSFFFCGKFPKGC